jgi:hypothetical protein
MMQRERTWIPPPRSPPDAAKCKVSATHPGCGAASGAGEDSLMHRRPVHQLIHTSPPALARVAPSAAGVARDSLQLLPGLPVDAAVLHANRQRRPPLVPEASPFWLLHA